MKVSAITLTNFRRFTDLTILDIPRTTKLVLVVGPNGCGKSSLFDGFLQWYRGPTGFGHVGDELYFRKDKAVGFAYDSSVKVTLHDNAVPTKGSLYLRSAYRNEPDFTVSGFGAPADPSQQLRVGRVIDNDATVSENYIRLVFNTISAMYKQENDSRSVVEVREELIGKIQESMRRVFGDLILNNISDPLGSGSFLFDKGSTKKYHYKNLSGGEKAAFDLILDLHIKKAYFTDAIYCVDELETHIHTKVQGALLREIVKILPDKAQLWATTHSLGVMRAALDEEVEKPGTVALIDFDGVDPDVAQEIRPSSLGRVAWEKMLSITLDDLSPRVAPSYVIVCEGSTLGNQRCNFDAEIYNRVLGQTMHDVVFISGGNSNEVLASGASIQQALSSVLKRTSVVPLKDRDDLTDRTVAEMNAGGILVLDRRNIESYLLADDVIEALVNKYANSGLLHAAMEVKRAALASCVAQGKPADDLKSAAGDIFAKLKRLLGLQRRGNSRDEFMRDTLAPLITPNMASYQELAASIRRQLRGL